MTRFAPRRLVVTLAGIAALAVAGGGPAHAQERPAESGQPASQPADAPGAADWGPLSGRLSLHLNAAYQATTRDQRDTLAFRAYGENAAFEAARTFDGGAMTDVGGGILVWRELSVGATYTQLNGVEAATVTGTVPHPLDFNARRTAAPQTLELIHRERATHLHASWRVPLTPRIDVAVFGGPTFFNLRQGMVTDVTAREAGGPPFSRVDVSVATGEHSRNALGFNVGADVTVMATRVIGVGYFVRFAQATVDVPRAAAGTQAVTVGGFQTGGGLRLRF